MLGEVPGGRVPGAKYQVRCQGAVARRGHQVRCQGVSEHHGAEGKARCQEAMVGETLAEG